MVSHAVVLLLALAAAYAAFRCATDPPPFGRARVLESVDMDSSRNPEFPVRFEPAPKARRDPLEKTPELRAAAQRLMSEIGEKTNNIGAVVEIQKMLSRFAMLAFRRLGRKDDETSVLDADRAANDLALVRARISNALQALHVTVHRDRLQARLDEISDAVMAATDAYVRAVREKHGSANVYEAGRGFPSGWSDSYDNSYDMVV